MNLHAIDAALSAALASHAECRIWLSATLSRGRVDEPMDEIGRCACCAFGEWLHGPDIDETMRADKPWRVTSRLHAEFHESAGEVARLAATGRQEDARALMESTCRERSDRLVKAITLWQSEIRAETSDEAA